MIDSYERFAVTLTTFLTSLIVSIQTGEIEVLIIGPTVHLVGFFVFQAWKRIKVDTTNEDGNGV